MSSETLSMLDKLFKEEYERPSTTFTYAMLAEISRILELCSDKPPEDLIKAYSYIAKEYMHLGHYMFAKKYYEKALALSEKCPNESEIIEDCRENLSDINGKKQYRIRRDKVEYTKKYQKILIELEAKIEDELKGVPRRMGFCFAYWEAKKRILKKDYGIEWNSPSVLNPGVMFD